MLSHGQRLHHGPATAVSRSAGACPVDLGGGPEVSGVVLGPVVASQSEMGDFGLGGRSFERGLRGRVVHLAALLLIIGCGSSLSSGTGGSGTSGSDGGGGIGGALGSGDIGGSGRGGVGGLSGFSGADGSASQGMPYTCVGGFVVTADGGAVAAPDAGSPAICIVGQTYCYLALPHPDTTGEATASCRAFEPGVEPACAQDPTCACFCDLSRGGFHCQTECRCSETNGFATVSCQAI
jgi:hypothetical protein